MFKLTKNPIFRIIGVSLILYFTLFNDKNNPNFLGNLVSPQNIKSELQAAKEKSRFIISNVSLARQMSQKNKAAQALKNNTNPNINNIKISII